MQTSLFTHSRFLKDSFFSFRYFFTTSYRRFVFVLQIGTQFAAPAITVLITFYLLLPWFLTLEPRQRLLVATLSPLLGTTAKVTAYHLGVEEN